MSKYIATNRFLWISSISHLAPWICHNLVRYEHCNIELLTDFLQFVQNFAKHILSLGQLPSAWVVDSERSHDRVNHQQGVLVLGHCPSPLHQQVDQGVHSEGAPDHYVVEDLLGIQIEPFGDRLNPFRSEGVFCVDVQYFSLPSTLGLSKLGCHT